MILGTFQFADGKGSFILARMIGNRYRGVVTGRRVTRIGQITFFYGDLQPDGSLRFANALFTSKRLMPLIGPGPVIHIDPDFQSDRMLGMGATGTLTMEDGPAIYMKIVGTREDPGNFAFQVGKFRRRKRPTQKVKKAVAAEHEAKVVDSIKMRKMSNLYNKMQAKGTLGIGNSLEEKFDKFATQAKRQKYTQSDIWNFKEYFFNEIVGAPPPFDERAPDLPRESRIAPRKYPRKVRRN